MLQVILFEPEIPPNTGNVIRLCANTGASLHLVKPLGFRMDDKSLQRSGLDYHDIAQVRVHSNWQECLLALEDARVFAVETGSRVDYPDVRYRIGDALVFGSETRGLPDVITRSIGVENVVTIPMCAASRSLNLSNAVAVVVFEAWRQLQFAGRRGA